jgi:hypothetical protein
MMRRRSSALIVSQPAISLSVRPQPRHSSDAGSMTQIFTQGESIDGMAGQAD